MMVGALPHLAVDFCVASGLLDEAVDLAQAKASAVARLLCRKEGLKGVTENVPRHSASGVSHANGDVLTRRQFRIEPAVIIVGGDVGCFQSQLSAVGHGVTSVDRQINDG
ncbi:methylaspartate ammonia-lyase [Bradyrhizobium sp. GM6.1]